MVHHSFTIAPPIVPEHHPSPMDVTPRAERSMPLTAAKTKAVRDACGSPRTQQMLPVQTNLLEPWIDVGTVTFVHTYGDSESYYDLRCVFLLVNSMN